MLEITPINLNLLTQTSLIADLTHLIYHIKSISIVKIIFLETIKPGEKLQVTNPAPKPLEKIFLLITHLF